MKTRKNAAARARNPFLETLATWFDSGRSDADSKDDGIDWFRVIPFILMHVACLGVFFVGISPIAAGIALFLYAIRMFAITAFYHRYFSHRAFRTSRVCQFVFALIGASAVQRGPLWWAAHHRDHHRHTDRPQDVHSPKQHGFLWSHLGWFLSRSNFATRWNAIPDWKRFPELRFLDRFDTLVPAGLAVVLFLCGEWARVAVPSWQTSGAQLLVWGFFVSTVVLYHVTFCVNSVAHLFGSRQFETQEDSRNNALLALLTFGEGWHNNHHRFPAAARQGIAWWQLDLTYSLLRCMQMLGLVRDLRPLPARKHNDDRNHDQRRLPVRHRHTASISTLPSARALTEVKS